MAEEFEWDMQVSLSKMQDQEKDLRRDLRQKEGEIQELSEALLLLQSELEQASLVKESSSAQVARDITKKNRDLTMALEREKSKVRELKAQVKEGQRLAGSPKAGAASGSPVGAKKRSKGGEEGMSPEELAKAWQTKFHAANSKLNKEAAKATEAKQSLKRALRALQRELGPEADLSVLSDAARQCPPPPTLSAMHTPRCCCDRPSV